jgi:hypothetical protein
MDRDVKVRAVAAWTAPFDLSGKVGASDLR